MKLKGDSLNAPFVKRGRSKWGETGNSPGDFSPMFTLPVGWIFVTHGQRCEVRAVVGLLTQFDAAGQDGRYRRSIELMSVP